MSRSLRLLSLVLGVLVVGGCGPKLSLGSVTINGTAFDVTSEGSNQAGAMNNYAVKPATGNAGITMVQTGVGVDAASAAADMVTCNYDAADGDYDCNVLLPNPIPSGAMLWITVTGASGATVGSIAIPAN